MQGRTAALFGDAIIKSAVQALSDRGVTHQEPAQYNHFIAVFYFLHKYGASAQREATQPVQIYDFVLL